MYCVNCSTDLTNAPGDACPVCGVAFDRADPQTFMPRPLPGRRAAIRQFILTTLVAAFVAFVVGNFQLARASGH